MKIKIFSVFLAMLLLLCSVTSVFAAQGTDGDELQVMEAQHLEIQLGTAWAGTKFTLRTDAGIYPGVITVDNTGLLSLEIGGSTRYVLSCMPSKYTLPDLTNTQAPVTNETETIPENLVPIEEVDHSIPVAHIVLFAGGMVIAIAILVVIYVTNKKRRIVQNDEEED